MFPLPRWYAPKVCDINRRLLPAYLWAGWMQWESHSKLYMCVCVCVREGFVQSRWYVSMQISARLRFQNQGCTLFWAYTIVPSNVPLPDCKSDMSSFWTSMPPEETVTCKQMNEKQMKKQTTPQCHYSCMWMSNSHVIPPVNPWEQDSPAHSPLCLCSCSYMELTWRYSGRITFKKKWTIDFHSKWCRLHQGTLCLFFLSKWNWQKENSKTALFVVYTFSI